MTDIVLNNIGSGFNRSRINNNFDVLEEVVNNGIVHLEGGNNIMRQNLDMNSKRLLNLPDPENVTEPVPYGLLLELLGDSGAAVTSPLVQPRQVGDGATTTFATPTSTQVNPSFLFVYLDGVKQRPTTDYSVNSDGTLEFTEAPPMASLIDITLYTPTFKAIDGNEEVIATGTTTPRSLADRFGDVVNVKDFNSLQESLSYIENSEILLTHDSQDITINVPSTTSTLKKALEVCVKIYPRVPIKINLEAGYEIEEGYAFIDKDYSNVEIISSDTVVKTATGVTWIRSQDYPTSTGDVAGSTDILFLALNSKTPTFNILIDLESKVSSQGLNLGAKSQGRIRGGKGFINAGGSAVLALSGSTLVANSGVFTGSGQRGAWISAASTAVLQGADLSEAADIGLFCSRASRAEFTYGRAENCGGRGIRVSSSSLVMASNSVLDGCEVGAQARTGGVLDFEGGSAMNCNSWALDCNAGGNLNAGDSTISSLTTNALSVFSGGKAEFRNGIATAPVGYYGMVAQSGGFIVATNSPATTPNTINKFSRDGYVLDAGKPDHSDVVVTTNADGTARAYPDGLLIFERTVSPDFNSTADQRYSFPLAYFGAPNPAVYLSTSYSSSTGFRDQIKDSILMADESEWVLAFGTAGLTTGFPLQLIAITRWK